MLTEQQIVAKVESLADQCWKEMESILPHLERIANHGLNGSARDLMIVRQVFSAVVGEIHFRAGQVLAIEGD